MEDLLPTVVPKSDQINADDLMSPITAFVVGMKPGPSDQQPIDIEIIGHRPYRPCLSMRRVLISAWGKDGTKWVGRSMILFRDPTITFGGVALGGIRISHLSHIEKDMSIMLTTKRGHRKAYPVKAMQVYPQDQLEKNLTAWATALAEGKIDMMGLIARAAVKGWLTDEQLSQIEAGEQK